MASGDRHFAFPVRTPTRKLALKISHLWLCLLRGPGGGKGARRWGIGYSAQWGGVGAQGDLGRAGRGHEGKGVKMKEQHHSSMNTGFYCKCDAVSGTPGCYGPNLQSWGGHCLTHTLCSSCTIFWAAFSHLGKEEVGAFSTTACMSSGSGYA